MVCVSGHEHTRRSTRHNAKLFCHQQTAQLQKVDSRKSQEKAGAQTRAIKTQYIKYIKYTTNSWTAAAAAAAAASE